VQENSANDFDLDLVFDDGTSAQEAPAAQEAAEPASDPRLEFLEALDKFRNNPYGQQMLAGLGNLVSQNGTPAPAAPAAPQVNPIDAEIERLEKQIEEYTQNGQPIPADLAKTYYMKLGAKGALESLAPTIQKTQVVAQLDYYVNEAKEAMRRASSDPRYPTYNPLFPKYEADFERELRQRIQANPSIASDPNSLAAAAREASRVALADYVTRSVTKRGTPPQDPATGRFIPQKSGRPRYEVPQNVYGLTAENIERYGLNQDHWQMDIREWEKAGRR